MRCANHPQRAAVGRCPNCGRLVCGECHVRIDGILHCRDCIQEKARTITRARPRVLPRVGTTLAALALLLPALAATAGMLGAAGFVAGHLSRLFAVELEQPGAESEGE